MPYIKITYSSPRNVSVRGVDYFEIDAEELNEDGTVPEEIRQEAVNSFMGDTFTDVVENEGE